MTESLVFDDREEAGQQLSSRLPPLDPDSTVVIALPRGGVPVAEPIARALHLPLDVVFVRKIGLPGHPELAVGAVCVVDAPVYVTNAGIAAQAGLSGADIEALAAPELAEIARRRTLWHGTRPPVPVAGKTVLVVDDGIATGATMKAALQGLRRAGAARLILAVPVAPPDTLAELSGLVEQVVCLSSPERFGAVGLHYRDFRQVSDAEVAEALRGQTGRTPPPPRVRDRPARS